MAIDTSIATTHELIKLWKHKHRHCNAHVREMYATSERVIVYGGNKLESSGISS